MVINRDTEIKNCVDIALRQDFNNKILKDIYEENYIKFLIVDMNEKHIYNTANIEKEIDNGSCGRWNLLYNMLKEAIQKIIHIMGIIKVINMSLFQI